MQSDAAVSRYPDQYEEMVLRLDEAGRMAERARKLLANLNAAGNAADACQIGKAIALTYVAETALKEAESVIGRTTQDLWRS